LTQPSRIFELWTRLYRRFLIEPFPADGAGPSVSTTIQPTTDADELLKIQAGGSVNGDLTASAGSGVTYFTVPNGKRWTLRHIFREGSTANSRVFYQGPGAATVYLSALATAEGVVPVENIVVEQDRIVGMFTTGDAGDAAIFMMLVADEIDAFN